MHTALCIAALAGVAYSAPQLINLDKIAAAPKPELVKAPVNVVENIAPDVASDPIVPLVSVSATKRDLELQKRDGDCSPYPTGSGPVPTPDTAEAFQADPEFADEANSATTPDGYSSVFTNKGASLQASNYMGLYTLTSYDTLTCASKCDQAEGCQAFNVFLERDPTLNANLQQCPNPPSTTNYRCTLWGAPVSVGEATNTGQYQADFHVVIAGSNAYNKAAPPPAISGYTGPQELGGAINAPTDSGSYLGYQYYPFSQAQGYDPQTCADACDAQTLYDSQHPAADGSFESCNFFNSYVLSENGIPQGLYCSMYNKAWDRSYGTNYGQYRGSDRYTVSESYSYNKSSYSGQPPPGSTSLSTSSSSMSTSSTKPVSSVTVVSSQAPSSTSASASSRASSAISSTATQTTSTPAANCVPTPANNIVQNGGFECSLAPWVAADVVHTRHSITSLGDNSAFAYEFDQIGPIGSDSSIHPASVNQDLIVTVGQAYQLTYRTYFDKCTSSEGFVGLMLNHQAVTTTDACDLGAAAFKTNSYNFTATVNPFNLRFEFVTNEPTAVIKIDNVVAIPTTAGPAPSCTNSILQNGNFESGALPPWTTTNIVGSSSASIVASTDPNAGGQYAADAALAPSGSSNGLSSLTLQQTLTVCAGTNYSVSYDYRFDASAASNCSISVQYPYKETSGSVTASSTYPGSVAGSWMTNNYVSFQARASNNVLKIVASCANGRSSHLQVDNVKAAFYPGNAFG